MLENNVKCPDNVLNGFYSEIFMKLFKSIKRYATFKKKKNSRDYCLSILSELEEDLVLCLNRSVEHLYKDAYRNAYNDIIHSISNNSNDDV